MLTKLILLNSAVYSKAIIQLDRNSIQLTGNNNSGKSSLIQALNFLLIPDSGQFYFGINRTVSDSLAHYFPSVQQSYLLYEFKKEHQYFCLLIKKEKDDRLSYYHLNTEFKEEYFFPPDNPSILPRSFKELLKYFEKNETGFHLLENKEIILPLLQYFNIHFPLKIKLDKEYHLYRKLYRLYPFLIDVKLFEYEDLKKYLILANQHDVFRINFSEKSQFESMELLRLKNQMQALESQKATFDLFEKKKEETDSLNIKIQKLYGDFLEKQSLESYEADVQISQKIREISTIQNETNLVLKPAEAKMLKEIGVLEYLLNQKTKELKSAEDDNVFALKEENKTIRNHLYAKEEELDFIKKQIADKSYLAMGLQKGKEELEKKRKEIQVLVEELQNKSIEAIEEEKPIKQSAYEIYQLIQNCLQDLDELNIAKNELFNELKTNLNIDFDQEESLTAYFKREQDTLKQKTGKIQDLLANIANYYVLPAKKLLEKYRELKDFIKKYTRLLKKSSISDIRKIEIVLLENKSVIDGLEQIAGIKKITSEQLQLSFETLPTDHHKKEFEVLSNYLEKNTSLDLNHLFDLQIKITKKTNKYTANLQEQIESEGTNRMLKLTMMLNLFKLKLQKNESSKSIVCIDDLGSLDTQNIEGIKNFCNENGFILVFTSTNLIKGFVADKYYFLKTHPENSKIEINESNAVYNDQ